MEIAISDAADTEFVNNAMDKGRHNAFRQGMRPMFHGATRMQYYCLLG